MFFQRLASNTQAPVASKWVAFGISEPGSGSMPGSDTVICVRDEEEEWKCIDGKVNRSHCNIFVSHQKTPRPTNTLLCSQQAPQ
jgi:hypothetical protein